MVISCTADEFSEAARVRRHAADVSRHGVGRWGGLCVDTGRWFAEGRWLFRELEVCGEFGSIERSVHN